VSLAAPGSIPLFLPKGEVKRPEANIWGLFLSSCYSEVGFGWFSIFRFLKAEPWPPHQNPESGFPGPPFPTFPKRFLWSVLPHSFRIKQLKIHFLRHHRIELQIPLSSLVLVWEVLSGRHCRHSTSGNLASGGTDTTLVQGAISLRIGSPTSISKYSLRTHSNS
jgi:hypothetical protein